jgi:hypothetical protein
MKQDIKIKSIHFVGIKGVGMTPLALIAKEAGLKVTGSDVDEVFITDEPLKKAGIVAFPSFSALHIENVDLVITTGAHGGFTNPEVIAAKEKDIPVLTQGEAVGVFMKGEIFDRKTRGISVAGTHGKTTTTAMIASIFKACKLDPTYVIGTSMIPSLGSSGHYGKGDFFIAEAEDGNLTSAIVTTGTVNTSVIGPYTKTYSVTDHGNPPLSASVTRTINGLEEKSTDTTFSFIISVPKRVTCLVIFSISSGPKIPSGNPGKFSTSVVNINCPPGAIPPMTKGFNSARAAYKAAVKPAGPLPIIIVLRMSCVLVM